MKAQWLIIPEYERLKQSVELANEYGAAFEYDDFFMPSVYQDRNELERRMETYLAIDRDRSKDTVHGAFLDLAPSSPDSVIRARSVECMKQSMEVATRLGAKGVVFHSGLVAGVEGDKYISNWMSCIEQLFREMAAEYPGVEIYLENTIERIPDYHVEVMKHLTDITCVGLCLDYGHGILTSTQPEEWIKQFAPFIKHIHLNDNDLMRDLHSVPGDGKIDFDLFSQLIAEYNINAPILLELAGVDNQRRALEFMKKL